MKNTLTHSLKHALKYSRNQIQSLQILSMNVAQLEEYIEDIAKNNPLIEFDHSINQCIEFSSEILIENETSLSDFLLEQLKFIPHSKLCELLIYELNSNGYFRKTYDELLITFSTNPVQLDNAIQTLQSLEPFGIASFCLKECLKIQIKLSDFKEKEHAILLLDFLPQIAENNMQAIIDGTKLLPEEITHIIHFIKTLNPKPASNFSTGANILLPDIIIETNNDIHVQIHNINERIHFIDDYKKQKELKQFYDLNKRIKEQINLRNKTLSLVINAIIEFQYDYFIFQKPLKAMKLKDIASMTQLSISTISRAIQDKVISKDNQYILLKSLFSKSINNISVNTIQEKIKEITEAETIALSDQKIVKRLKEEGIIVARRTVNKYRKQLKIKSSHDRPTKDM